MKKILIPVDFSSTSKNALHYAVALFKDISKEITLLHIYGTPTNTLMMKSIDSILIKDAESDMNDLLNEIKAEAPNVVFKTKLGKNYAVSIISDLGNSGNYDYIVMGTKGVSGVKEVFLGSIAGGVVANTSAPVIVVPLDYKFNSSQNMVLAIGNEAITNYEVLNPLADLVKLHKSKLEILHFSDEDEVDFEALLPVDIKELQPGFTHKTGIEDLNRQLSTHIQNYDTDLLCMVRTRKDFFERFFNGSVTLKQTFNSAAPLLILHQ